MSLFSVAPATALTVTEAEALVHTFDCTTMAYRGVTVGLWDGGATVTLENCEGAYLGDDSILNGDIVPGGWMTNSGNNNSEACDMNSEFFCAGGGAGGDAPSRVDGGAGVLASDVAGNSDLFPEIDGEPELGAGGDAILDGSSTIEDTPNIPGHGGNAFSQSTGGDGIDGAVYLRWPAPADSLASTGFDATSGIAAAGAVAAGAAILVATRRRAVRG